MKRALDDCAQIKDTELFHNNFLLPVIRTLETKYFDFTT